MNNLSVEDIKKYTKWDKHHQIVTDIFSKYKKSHNVFVETGTHVGNGVSNALVAGFETVISIEIDADNFNIASERYSDEMFNDVVYLFHGPTSIIINEILEQIEYPCLFWLDAHFHDASATYKELEFIKEHPIKTHTILIDDIPLYFNKNHIEKTILDINPNYKFCYETSIPAPEYILAAWIDDE